MIEAILSSVEISLNSREWGECDYRCWYVEFCFSFMIDCIINVQRNDIQEKRIEQWLHKHQWHKGGEKRAALDEKHNQFRWMDALKGTCSNQEAQICF